MGKNRLEAFSDGVPAIVITIMVLEMKVPHGATLDTLQHLVPVFLSYVLSFVYIAIYWNNHHHLLQTPHHVNGRVLWANLHLLFWLSLHRGSTRMAGAGQAHRARHRKQGNTFPAASAILHIVPTGTRRHPDVRSAFRSGSFEG